MADCWRVLAKSLIEVSATHPGPDPFGFVEILMAKKLVDGDLPSSFLSVFLRAAISLGSSAAVLSALQHARTKKIAIESLLLPPALALLSSVPEAMARIDVGYFTDPLDIGGLYGSHHLALLVRLHHVYCASCLVSRFLLGQTLFTRKRDLRAVRQMIDSWLGPVDSTSSEGSSMVADEPENQGAESPAADWSSPVGISVDTMVSAFIRSLSEFQDIKTMDSMWTTLILRYNHVPTDDNYRELIQALIAAKDYLSAAKVSIQALKIIGLGYEQLLPASFSPLMVSVVTGALGEAAAPFPEYACDEGPEIVSPRHANMLRKYLEDHFIAIRRICATLPEYFDASDAVRVVYSLQNKLDVA